MESSTVRIRPLRFAFLVDPRDKTSLQVVFEMNSSLWGGVFNFIIPLFKSVPPRYKQSYQRQISAKAMLKGLVEAFQPDFLVETKPGQAAAYDISFPETRTIQLEDLAARDERGRCKIGIDLRSVCHDLYEESFRFVQRHPPEVIIPASTDKSYSLLFSAVFGSIPDTDQSGDVGDVFIRALDGKRLSIEPIEFPNLFHHKYAYPLRVTQHKIETRRNSWSIDSKLFYMDHRSSYDLIEYWNLRALGWPIRPLPVSLLPELTEYCEDFVVQSYKPFPPPSNAYHHASFLCARSQEFEKMRAFAITLKRSPPRYPKSRPPGSADLGRVGT